MGPFVSCQAWLGVLVRGRRTHTAFSQAVDGEQLPSEQHFGPTRRARGLNNAGNAIPGLLASETRPAEDHRRDAARSAFCSAWAPIEPLNAQRGGPSQPNALRNDGGQRHNTGE